MKRNRFVAVTLIAFDILVVFGLGLFCARQGRNPVGEAMVASVVDSYVEAMDYEDYQKAYSYLADMENKPTYEQFRQAFINRYTVPADEGVSVKIRTINIKGNEASVDLIMTDWPEAPWSNPYRTEDMASLVKQDDQWKLFSMLIDYYWDENWYQKPDWP